VTIEHHPAIAEELEEIRDCYESKSAGLEMRFVDEFERLVLGVASMPTRWMIVEADIRRALMKRFPYVILFRVIADDCVRITVVKHEKRHPVFGIARR